MISLTKLNNLSKWRAALAVVTSKLAGFTVVLAVATAASTAAFAKEAATPANITIPLASLPPQAQETHRLVFSGGPFPYSKDGVVFGNRERQLPRQARGFYHEYTVKTPGASNRGARRIVCGGEPKTRPEVCYYTNDHYATFNRIAP